MRELKFKVWDKLEKRMILPDQGYQGHYVLSLKGEFHNLQNGSGGKEYIVQQYTGLKDKNGKEIYEGDIFKGGDYKWDAVRFEGGQFEVNLMGARVFTLQELCCDIDYELPEVIGNIFETPELLK
jgi:uncharacterized phage protein (TIGR01671 family)